MSSGSEPSDPGWSIGGSGAVSCGEVVGKPLRTLDSSSRTARRDRPMSFIALIWSWVRFRSKFLSWPRCDCKCIVGGRKNT